jgi:hypothetical protein
MVVRENGNFLWNVNKRGTKKSKGNFSLPQKTDVGNTERGVEYKNMKLSWLRHYATSRKVAGSIPY